MSKIFSVNTTKNDTPQYRKIINHFSNSLSNASQNYAIFVEKDYLKFISPKFRTGLHQAIKKVFPQSKLYQYEVGPDLKKTTYYYKNKIVSDKVLTKLKKLNYQYIDFIYSGRAFYKQSHLKKGIFVVRLSEKNTDLFSYNKLKTLLLTKHSKILQSHFSNDKTYSVNNLSFKLLSKPFFYSGYGSNSKKSKSPDLRILPLNTISIFTSNPNKIKMNLTKTKIHGQIHTDGVVEDINNNLKHEGKIHLSIKNNKIINLMINSKKITLSANHTIVHLTFGVNHFKTRDHHQISDLERNRRYICIGVEDEHKHIDICFKHNLFSLKNIISIYAHHLFKKLKHLQNNPTL